MTTLLNLNYYRKPKMRLRGAFIGGASIGSIRATVYFDTIEDMRKEVEARIKAFLNDLFLAISSFIELLAPLFDLELIFKLLEKKHNLIPKLVSISIRDLAFIDQQLSDENQPILLG